MSSLVLRVAINSDAQCQDCSECQFGNKDYKYKSFFAFFQFDKGFFLTFEKLSLPFLITYFL